MKGLGLGSECHDRSFDWRGGGGGSGAETDCLNERAECSLPWFP